MGQIQGSLQNVELDVTGGSSYKTLVCLRTSSINITTSASTEDTNCGTLTSVGDPVAKVDFDAICEVSPSGSQVTYKDLLTAQNAKTQINVRIQNPVVTGSSAGATYYHQFYGYITDLTLSQETTTYVKFSGSISSTGTIDITA